MGLNSQWALLDIYETPQDGSLNALLTEFLSLAQPHLGLLSKVYAATLPEFFNGVEAAHARGCDDRGVFDHSQAEGTIEAAALTPFLAAVGKANYAIGTSIKGKQLVHDKKIVANCPMYPVADVVASGKDPTAYSGWREAMVDNYPVTWFGSWNFSRSGSIQSNTVCIVVSLPLARFFRDRFLEDFTWIRTHEPEWNTVMRALATGKSLEGLTR